MSELYTYRPETSRFVQALTRSGRLTRPRPPGSATSTPVESPAVEARARRAERLVLQGADTALDAVEQLAGTAVSGRQQVVVAMLDRLAGDALVQQGRTREGVARLHQGLASAREAAAPFEVALTLEALARVAPGDGSAARQAAEHFARLGVVSTPKVPLPDEL